VLNLEDSKQNTLLQKNHYWSGKRGFCYTHLYNVNNS